MIKWYKLYFETPVHIGERGVGVESVNTFIPSTTIWSALIYSMIHLDMIDPGKGFNGLLRVNTLTPVIEGETLFWIKGLDVILHDKAKKILCNKSNNKFKLFDDTVNILKKTMLASINLLKHDISECGLEAVSGKEEETLLNLECDNETYYFNDIIIGYALMSKRIEGEVGILNIEKRPRNIIDRITGSATPYHLSVVRYRVPLLLGVEILSNDLSPKDIEASLKLLGEIGVGGERTYGFGRFRYEETNLEIPVNNGGYMVSQGLYYPGAPALKKIMSSKSLYDVRIHGARGGLSGLVRRPVYALSEGSIISSQNYVDGLVVVDERNGDRVARSFDPLFLKISLQWWNHGA